MKYKTIGAFKSVQNIPYCKAAVDMCVGMGVMLDRVAKIAALPASEDECKACQYIVTNINDKPEIRNHRDIFKVNEGEFVRADDLATVANLEIEFANFEVTDFNTVAVGDKLVFGTDGLLVKSDAADDYKVHFEVIALTAYMDAGLLAVIRVK